MNIHNRRVDFFLMREDGGYVESHKKSLGWSVQGVKYTVCTITTLLNIKKYKQNRKCLLK